MAKTAVNPSSLMKPIGFSHGFEVRGGRILFLAGQVAFDKAGRVVGRGDIVAQFRQVCENLKAVVEAQGGTLQDVVKLNIYVTDRNIYMDSRPAIGEVYREYFGRHFPAMTLAEVKGLYDQTGEVMLEIEGIAALD
jgi:enamine deaminase RidA (YjgF/YER057c/UK114 family)